MGLQQTRSLKAQEKLFSSASALADAEQNLAKAKAAALKPVEKTLLDLRSRRHSEKERLEDLRRQMPGEADEKKLSQLKVKLLGLEFGIITLGRQIFSIESRAQFSNKNVERAMKKLERANEDFARALGASKSLLLESVSSLDDSQARRDLSERISNAAFTFRTPSGQLLGEKGNVIIERKDSDFRMIIPASNSAPGYNMVFRIEPSGSVRLLFASETDSSGTEKRFLHPVKPLLAYSKK